MAPRKQKKNVLVQRMLCSFLVILFFLSIYAKNINAFFQNIFSEYFGMQGAQVADTLKIKYTDQQKKDLISSLTAGKATLQTSIDAIKKQIYYYKNTADVSYDYMYSYKPPVPDPVVFWTTTVQNAFKKIEVDFVDLDQIQKTFSATLLEITEKINTTGIQNVGDADIKLLTTESQSVSKAIDALQKKLTALTPKILTLDMNPDWSVTANDPVNPHIDFHWSRNWNTTNKKILTGKFDFGEYNSYFSPYAKNLDANINHYDVSLSKDRLEKDGTYICFQVVIQAAKIISNQRCFKKDANGKIVLLDKSVDEYNGPIGTHTTTGVFINAPVPNFTSSNITTRSATLTWQKVDGAVGYAIYRENNLVAVIKATQKLSYTEDPILIPDKEYTYTIIPLSSLENIPKKLPKQIISSQEKNFFYGLVSFLEIQKVYAEVAKTVLKIKTSTIGDVKKSGEMKILAVIFRWSDTPLDKNLETIPSLKLKLSGTQDSLKEFYQRESFEKLKITPQVVSSVVTIDYPAPTNFNEFNKDSSFVTDINQAVYNLGYNLNNYNVIIYVSPSYDDSNIAGQFPDLLNNNFDLLKGSVFINGSQDATTYSHEIGHVLGFEHAVSTVCDTKSDKFFFSLNFHCDTNQYGDSSDVMGGGRPTGLTSDNWYSLDSYRKFQAGWISEKKITSTGNYEIFSNNNQKVLYRSIDLGNSDGLYLNYYFNASSGKEHKYLKLKLTSSKNGPSQVFGFKDYILSILDLFSENDYYKTPYYISENTSQSRLKSVTVIQLSKDLEKARVFVRFQDKIENIKAKINPDNESVFVSWDDLSILSENGGYRVYRDYDSSGPNLLVCTTQSTTCTDSTIPSTDKNPHTYTVVAYDAFTELPGKEYPMDPSASSNSVTLSPVTITPPTPPAPSGSCKKTGSGQYTAGGKYKIYLVDSIFHHQKDGAYKTYGTYLVPQTTYDAQPDYGAVATPKGLTRAFIDPSNTDQYVSVQILDDGYPAKVVLLYAKTQADWQNTSTHRNVISSELLYTCSDN